jgi:hypothetical protein
LAQRAIARRFETAGADILTVPRRLVMPATSYGAGGNLFS